MSLEAVKRNGHHLDLGHFEKAGEYGIPVLYPVRPEELGSEPIRWLRFNHALSEPDKASYGVHFFTDDYLFQRAWSDPPRYALFLRRFRAVMTPDFSVFSDYPPAVQIYNHWRKHELGAYWQSIGMTVIPSISWAGKESYSWCFDGEPLGGVVAVSSVGTQKSAEGRRLFLDGYAAMKERLSPTRIIFFGAVPKECEGDRGIIEHVSPYYQVFTRNLAFSEKEW